MRTQLAFLDQEGVGSILLEADHYLPIPAVGDAITKGDYKAEVKSRVFSFGDDLNGHSLVTVTLHVEEEQGPETGLYAVWG